MQYRDYYQIMGVARDASNDDIKRAYRKLARKYHPDVSKEPDAETQFKAVNEAYEVLKDAQKRAAYDQLGNQWQSGQDFRPPPDWQTRAGQQHWRFNPEEAGGFSDFFSSLFGQGTAGAEPAGPQYRGQVSLSLEEAYQGTTRTLEIPQHHRDASGRRSTRTLRVKIPAGVMPGQTIRVGSGPEEVHLEVQLQPHPLFTLEGRDVSLTLPVTPWEAVLGETVPVPTLGGTVELKLPANAQSGQKLRLKGRGLPGKTPGDQYLTLQIMTPPALDEAARELYRKLAAALPFNPRSHLARS